MKPDKIIIDNVKLKVGREIIEKKPKTVESEREIEIPLYLYHKIISEPHTSEYVTNLSGRAISARFSRLTNSICRFHDLRHANASVMKLLDVPDAYAMARGGWATDNVYKNVYVQTLDEGKKHTDDKINSFFADLVGAHENAHEEEKSLIN